MSPHLSRASWRVSARTNGANTCVEASINGAFVMVRNSTEPDGPMLTVPAADWLLLLDHVAAGRLQGEALQESSTVGVLRVEQDAEGVVAVRSIRLPRTVVRYTPEEWGVFVSGVVHDGEFTLEWLQAGSPSVQSGPHRSTPGLAVSRP